ncbi:ankyrin repeat-containing domain protein [Trichoderma pleuroticola]
MASEKRSHDDYSVGWICALPKEQTAAIAMLDKRHPDLPKPINDTNTYTLGSIGSHNVVIACLPKGQYGNNSAANVATLMISAFPSIKVGLLVGIGGGVPMQVRLGDVVVSTPSGQYPGVVQWDLGKATEGGKFERTGALSNPPGSLLTALAKLETEHELTGSKIPSFLTELKAKYPRLAKKYLKSASLQDLLFRADYTHVHEPFMNTQGVTGGIVEPSLNEDDGADDECEESCAFCDKSKTLKRKGRPMRVHHGLIASGNKVIKDGLLRDEVNRSLGGDVLYFEMEAAGLMNNFPYLVIRGICDYCDSHKNKAWQEHAAAVAAAFAKESHEVQKWISTRNQTLFCQGVPGAGKTFQMAILVNSLIETFRSDDTVGVAYLYYNFKRQQDQKAEQMVANLIKQLAQISRPFPESVHQLRERHGPAKTRPFLEELSDNLTMVIQPFSRVFILIDALDEGDDSERTNFLGQMFAVKEKTGFNLFATSRIINTITATFEGSPSRTISPTRHDIFQFLNTRMSELPLCVANDKFLQDEIKASVASAIGGISPAAVKVALKDRRQAASSSDKSKVLNEAYDKSMERIQQLKGDLPRDGLLILSWIVKAKRQMKLAELQEALAVEVGSYALNSDNIPTVEHITQACASLLVIEGDTLELVHYTAQEYFEQPNNKWMQKAHDNIMQICMTYLSWSAYHANEALALTQDLKVSRAIEFLGNGQTQGSWYQDLLYSQFHFDPDFIPAKLTALHIAAFFGLHDNGWTSLSLALHHGHKVLAEVFLEKGANIEATGSSYQTPLAIAATEGHLDAVKWLVEKGANIEAQDHNKQTPLMLATIGNHDNVVGYFIEKGANMEAMDNNNATPFITSLRGTTKSTTELFIRKGVDINTTMANKYTPLTLAISNTDDDIVKLLIERGANLDNNNSNSPLHYAAQKKGTSGVQIVQLLLDNSADINAKNDNKHTALQEAVSWGDIEKGDVETIRVLLRFERVQVDKKDSDGRTPLSYAMEEGEKSIVKALLNSGQADVNRRDNEGRTPLSYAASSTIARLLLKEHRVDINSKDKQGRTPLWHAIERRNQELVKFLKKRGAKNKRTWF